MVPYSHCNSPSCNETNWVRRVSPLSIHQYLPFFFVAPELQHPADMLSIQQVYQSAITSSPWKKYLVGGTLITGVAIFLGNYLTNVVEKPSLYFQKDGDNSVVQEVVDTASTLKEFYYPPPWCYSGHLNTIMGSLVRRVPYHDIRRWEEKRLN